MAPLFVVLDANILFPLYLRELLLQLASEGIFSPIWSQAILDEATKNLLSQEIMTVEQAVRFEEILKKVYPEAMTDVPVEMIEKMTNHPKDRHVLATAVIAGSGLIVTNNLKDFQDKDLSLWNVTAQSPEEFLIDLYDLHTDEVINAVSKAAKRLKDKTSKHKPPLGLERLLDLLAKVVPGFSNNIKFHETKWEISRIIYQSLTKFGRRESSEERFLEGTCYRIAQKRLSINIFSKKENKEILSHQNKHIKSSLAQDDVDAFLKFHELLQRILFESSFQLKK